MDDFQDASIDKITLFRYSKEYLCLLGTLFYAAICVGASQISSDGR